MFFSFLKDEQKEVMNLIKKVFNIENDYDTFETNDNIRFLLLKENNKVVATTMITTKIDPIKNKKSFYLDYVCVDNEYQGKGLGKKMMEEIDKIAIEENVNSLILTSNKKREKARAMYQKNGFVIKDTDMFIKEIK